MAILIDLSQIALGSCYSFADELTLDKTRGDVNQVVNLIRHVILSQLKYYNNKYSRTYGKLIVCCDGRKYWRKQIFPYYKINRKKMRTESNLDWGLIFDAINMIIEDLRENFMFPVILVDTAESDDIIATLTQKLQEEGEPVLIISSDNDFIQLQKYPNVSQLSPRTKKLIKSDNPESYLVEKVIRGDKGDGIPSILNDDDSFINPQSTTTKMTQKRLNQLLECGFDNVDADIQKRWLRNKTLIDFDYIPVYIKNNVLDMYNQKIIGNKAKMFDYLIKHNCTVLLKDLDSFNVAE